MYIQSCNAQRQCKAYPVSIFSPCLPFTCAIPHLEAIRVEADEDVEVDSVQDPGNPGVALLLQEEGGKLQQHLVLSQLISSTSLVIVCEADLEVLMLFVCPSVSS